MLAFSGLNATCNEAKFIETNVVSSTTWCEMVISILIFSLRVASLVTRVTIYTCTSIGKKVVLEDFSLRYPILNLKRIEYL